MRSDKKLVLDIKFLLCHYAIFCIISQLLILISIWYWCLKVLFHIDKKNWIIEKACICVIYFEYFLFFWLEKIIQSRLSFLLTNLLAHTIKYVGLSEIAPKEIYILKWLFPVRVFNIKINIVWSQQNYPH
jgi:hypothetical protein